MTTTSPHGGVYSPAADLNFEDNQAAAKQLLISTGVDAVARGGVSDQGPALYRAASPAAAATLKTGLLQLAAAAQHTTDVLNYAAVVPGAECTDSTQTDYLCFFTTGRFVALVSARDPAGVETALLAEQTALPGFS